MTKTEALEEALYLIEYSKDWSRIAHEVWTPELHKALIELCDTYTDTNEGYDYWGNDPEDEDETYWRVILERGTYSRSERPTKPAPKTENPWQDLLVKATREHTKDALRLARLLEETGDETLARAARATIVGALRELAYGREMTGTSEEIPSGAV